MLFSRKCRCFWWDGAINIQEVLDFFELGQYAIDFSDLTAESLQKEFEKFIQEEETIRGKLDEHYEEVMESSKKNIVYVSEIVDEIVGE